MKMPSLYRTMRVEPFNIPIGFSEFVANFQIEANCYNAYVVLPALGSSSLMSTGKNVGSWRATIDEVDLTNVDVRISGDYPSTLYFDRLVDTFSNSQMQLRNLEGIATGAEAGKVRIIPIKIYSGMVNGSPILSPTMKRLQVRLLAEVGKQIEGGTAYLYKELYRQY
jgi:esterase/lipase superfamily enzyme